MLIDLDHRLDTCIASFRKYSDAYVTFKDELLDLLFALKIILLYISYHCDWIVDEMDAQELLVLNESPALR